MSTTNAWLTRNGASLKIPTGDLVLRPYGQGISYSLKLSRIINKRPKITGVKAKRVCKDTVYLKSLRKMCELYGVHGSYAGLAAAHAPEIYAGLFPYVHGQFHTFQDKSSDYNKIKPFVMELAKVHKRQGYTNFGIYHGDILSRLIMGAMGRYSIIDLDMMNPLSVDLIIRAGEAIDNAAADMAVVSIWHAVSRKRGAGKNSVPKLRSGLNLRLEHKFEVVDKDEISYYEPQTDDGRSGSPMRVDVYTLKRKVSIETERLEKIKQDMIRAQQRQDEEERKFQERLWKIQQESRVA